MKVLVTTGLYPPEIGGPATYSKLLKDELPKHGFEVRVLPFRIVRHLPKVVRHIVYLAKVMRAAKGMDVVYAQDPVSVGLPTCIATWLMRKHFAIRVAGDYAWEQACQRFGVKEPIDDFQNTKYGFKTEFLRKVQKGVVRRASVVVTPSIYFRDLVRGWAKRPECVHTIYNGIAFADAPEVKEKPKTIITAGRLVPWKGFEALIEMMVDMPDWTLEIAGDGPDRARLEEAINACGVGDRVKLFGQIPREELMERLAQARVFVLNTSFESFSFQTVEAMYTSTPVVVTSIGNLSEIVEDGTEGVLVSPDDTAAIRAAIERFESDDAFRAQVIAAAKAKAQTFSIDRTVRDLAELFRTQFGK